MIVGAFGLRKDPFRITPDPQFFFAGAKMRPALEELASALLSRRGLVLILGDSGTGKTTLLRKMEADLEAAGSLAIIITQPRTGIDDILLRWTEKLGVEAGSGDRAAMVSAIRARQRARGRDALAVILIDEADHCAEPLLRDLIALGVSTQDGGEGLQTVLAGQKVLETRLSLELPDLYRQVATVTHLERLSPSDVCAYIRHRLELAGYSGPGLFADQLFARIAELTDGVPRLINHLCGRALALASQAGESVVSRETLDEAASDCMLLAGPTKPTEPTKPTQPVAAAPQAAPRRASLVETLAVQKSAAVPPSVGEIEIPTLKTAEPPPAARGKAKSEPATPRASPEKGAAAVAVSAEGIAAQAATATSVEIPMPPVSRGPAKRAGRSEPANRTPSPSPHPERSEGPISELSVVALVAAPTEAADSSATFDDETIPVGSDESAIAPALGADTETVLERPRRAMSGDGDTTAVAAPAFEPAPAEMTDAPNKMADDVPARALAQPAAAESSPEASERYVPISRAAVSKLVGRRRLRLPSEVNDLASPLPAPEPPRAVSSPAASAFPTDREPPGEPAPAAVSSEIEVRRRRSVIESADVRHEPIVARSPGWLRRAALLGVLVAGVAAGTYAYYFWVADAPELPRAQTDTAAPATLPASPSAAAARDQPSPSGEGTPSTSFAGDDQPRAPTNPSPGSAEEDGSSERPALPIPKILRLPVIDPRQSSGAGPISAPGGVLPSESSPGRSLSVDAVLPSTVAALGTSQSTIGGGGLDSGVVITDAVTSPIVTPPQVPPEPATMSDRPSTAAATSSPAAELAPTPLAAPNALTASSPVPPAPATATFEPKPKVQEPSPPLAPAQPDPAPAVASTRSSAAQDAITQPIPSVPPPAAPAEMVTVEPAPAVASAAPATYLAPTANPSDGRTAEPAPVREKTPPPDASVDAAPSIDLSAPAATEPLMARVDDRSQGAAAEYPPQRASAPSAAGPGEIAPVRPVEPTRAAAVAVPPSPAPNGIRLTQGGGGVGAEQLIARGDIYLRDGDIASARLLFEAAVRLGNAAAARRIGTTYDPIEHRRLRIVGVSPNAQIALDWYRQAMEAGDAEARRRHAELSAWIARGGAR